LSPKSRVRRKPPHEPRPVVPDRSGRRSRWTAGFRPAWHKAAAVVLLVGGAGLFFVCEFDGWHLHEHSGHVWYLVGIAVAIPSAWWFRLFDSTGGGRRT
jgi:hypothetical protein